MGTDWRIEVVPGAHPEHVGDYFQLTAYRVNLMWLPKNTLSALNETWRVSDIALYLGNNEFLVNGERLVMFNDLHLDWNFYLTPAKILPKDD